MSQGLQDDLQQAEHDAQISLPGLEQKGMLITKVGEGEQIDELLCNAG